MFLRRALLYLKEKHMGHALRSIGHGLTNVVKVAAPVVGGIVGGPAGAAVGGLVSGALGGKSGGSSDQTATGSSATTVNPYLTTIPGYSDLIKRGVQGQGELPQYNENVYSQPGQFLTSNGQSSVSNALGQLKTIQGMGSSDYNKLISEYTNSDLVNQQKNVVQQDINNELASQLQNINQNASQTGNMGSSRAGVASGVASGKASEAWAKALVNINQNAYSNAQNLMNTQLGNQLATSSGLLNWGTSAYNQGADYNQQAADVNRMNTMMRQNPALYQAAQINTMLPGLASLSGTQQTQYSPSSRRSGLYGTIGGLAGGALGSIFNTNIGGMSSGSWGSQMGEAIGSLF